MAANGTGVTVTIPAGASFVDLVLTPTNDALSEAPETLQLTISMDG